jgi:NADP-dependent 3-hydroxy acid dehydrogenase YdfG
MGLATAQLLESCGASISLADINEEGLKSAIATLPSSQEHMYTVVDVCDGGKVDSWIKSTVEKYGKLDGAVNMAGIITKATPVKDLTDADWDFSFSVNTKGVFNCLRAQLNALQDGGSIVSCEDHDLLAHSLTFLTGLCSQRLRPIRRTRQCSLLRQ